jgi:muramoyltetrapeptide carboxypeptidase LdcA involved in peptidoglycan recycling
MTTQAANERRYPPHYAAGAPVVFNVDFGHADPQLVMPVGGRIRVDSTRGRIWVKH